MPCIYVGLKAFRALAKYDAVFESAEAVVSYLGPLTIVHKKRSKRTLFTDGATYKVYPLEGLGYGSISTWKMNPTGQLTPEEALDETLDLLDSLDSKGRDDAIELIKKELTPE